MKKRSLTLGEVFNMVSKRAGVGTGAGAGAVAVTGVFGRTGAVVGLAIQKSIAMRQRLRQVPKVCEFCAPLSFQFLDDFRELHIHAEEELAGMRHPGLRVSLEGRALLGD